MTADESPEGETILLVEDDEAVRQVLARFLRLRGFIVLEARNGEAALDQAGAYAAPIDVVVSDVAMPRMSGTELVHQLRGWFPSLRVLFISGYPDSARMVSGLQDAATAFLAKPFEIEQLERNVRELLDRDVHRPNSER
jgi:two-component system, cell cycle sensor histidine kinase and response regulator CckA